MWIDQLHWIVGILLYGGIWLAWGRRAAGFAMLGTLGLGLFVGVATVGRMQWLDWRERVRVEAEAREAEEASARHETELAKQRARCEAKGGTWWAAYEHCESHEEAAERLAREAESERERLVAEAEQEQLRVQAANEAARKAKLQSEFLTFRDDKERRSLIAHGGDEINAFQAIERVVSAQCGKLGGTPRQTPGSGFRVECEF